MTCSPRDHLFVLINTDGSIESQQREPMVFQHLRRSLGSTNGNTPIWGQFLLDSFWISWRKNYAPLIGARSIDDATVWVKDPFTIDSRIRPLSYQALSADDFALLLKHATFSLLYHPEWQQPDPSSSRMKSTSPLSLVSPTATTPPEDSMKLSFRMVHSPEEEGLSNRPSPESSEASPGASSTKAKKGRGETCSTCGVTVASDIKRHMRRHLQSSDQGRLMIKCPYDGCDVTKMQKSNLKSHIRAQHTLEYIYCPDELSCSFRTHDDASMLRHRKRYHGYQPYHRHSSAKNAHGIGGAVPSPWKGKKSFLTKSEKSQLLGVDDLDGLPQYIQPWKNVRPNPKALQAIGVPTHRKSSSAYSHVDSLSHYRDTKPLPSPRERGVSLSEDGPPSPLNSPIASSGNESAACGIRRDFVHPVARASPFRSRGLSNPLPPPSIRDFDVTRKNSLSALLHPTNFPLHPVTRPDSIPANMMELDPPLSSSSSPGSYYPHYASPHPREYNESSCDCDSDDDCHYEGHQRRHSLESMGSEDHYHDSSLHYRQRSGSHSPFSFSPSHQKPQSSAPVQIASPHPTSLAPTRTYLTCLYDDCRTQLPLNGTIVDEHWKTHHAPSEGEAVGGEFEFRCRWRGGRDREECSSRGGTIKGIRALWRHAMEHYDVPIPCPLGCGRLLKYGVREGVLAHLEVCENGTCQD